MHATGSWTTCPAATNLQPEEFFYRLWREATRAIDGSRLAGVW